MRNGITFAAVLLMVACTRESGDVSQSTPSQSSTMPASATAETATSSMNPVLPPQSDSPSSAPTAASATQEVHLVEYQIHMPATLQAGPIAFNVENGGKEDHAFEIEGNGIEEKTNVLKRGDSAALEVDLRPGTYTVYCPVKGHREKGMETKIVVK